MSTSININLAIGNAHIAEVEKYGYTLSVLPGDAQIRIRYDRDLPDGAPPPQLPQAVSAALNNNRGSILMALRARETAAKVTDASVPVNDPIADDAKKAE